MSFDLETAAAPEGLRRVAIDPVSRVEGHGKVTILLDAANRVQQVRLHIVEFRGFEKFIEGRPYWEVPVMVQRLCGICPVSHHLAASKALDVIVGAKRLTPAAEKLRRLMHYGQMLQSHALHFFHLCSPDLLFGFGSEAAKRNIVGVAAAHPETHKDLGVAIKSLQEEFVGDDTRRLLLVMLGAVFFVLLGQLIAAAAIDHFGLWGAVQAAITPKRVLGIAVIGVLLASYMGTQAQALGLGREYRGILGRADRIAVIVIVS